VAIESRHFGTTVVCPLCRASFVPAAASVEAVSEDHPPPELVSPGRDFADREGIDLDETHQPAVASAGEAERRLSDWKADMPAVPSAYRPSGQAPPAALGFMLLGTLLGAPGGALAGLLVGGISTAGLAGLVWLVEWMAGACGRVSCAVILFGGLFILLGYGLAYAALGWVAAALTTAMGQVGKNRNIPAAIAFSLSATLLGLILLHLSLVLLPDWLNVAALRKQFDPWLDYAALGVAGVGSVIAVIVAGITSRNLIHSRKFCEDCEHFMTETTLRPLGLGGLKALAQALNDGDLDAAADLLDAPAGQEGVPALFDCPHCGRGYLELTAKFRATWKGSEGDETKTEEWLAASVELDEREVDLFRPGSKR
jgi:hypothetical protein